MTQTNNASVRNQARLDGSPKMANVKVFFGIAKLSHREAKRRSPWRNLDGDGSGCTNRPIRIPACGVMAGYEFIILALDVTIAAR
jgi:hypothetical protein